MRTYKETCREWIDEKVNYCHAPAQYIFWGKLYPQEALGPRCEFHALKHVSWSALQDGQHAIYRLPVADDLRLVKIVPELVERLVANWQECEGIRLHDNGDGTFDVLVTRDLELAQFVEAEMNDARPL